MLLKLFRVLWFLSVTALLASLLFRYAGWQEQVIVREEATGQTLVARDALFYVLTTVFLVVNVLVYVVKFFYPTQELFRAWIHGLVITINLFFIVALNLISQYSSSEHFDYSRVGVVIYSSVILIVVWSVTWPLYALYQKFFIKQAV